MEGLGRNLLIYIILKKSKIGSEILKRVTLFSRLLCVKHTHRLIEF